jgi:hypothetical protein
MNLLSPGPRRSNSAEDWLRVSVLPAPPAPVVPVSGHVHLPGLDGAKQGVSVEPAGVDGEECW